ncbi:AprI/Inh family metalloprotease inhibitor [Brevundimonas sp. A19_0]|uniref:AprI/Inh family metalloprotease inhibitor n=1 Tax=Brevundimonas sp. A19_0 TaxID=2821087 RepID=UPI001ADD1952|nr:AprI/Inh family metalloprotease inhibitor [Brevundimonas sp. A19_0]MBO9500323.1 AprI/Inh family metalloprotease inhibitor [Brevundimonas sp. A19_0]
MDGLRPGLAGLLALAFAAGACTAAEPQASPATGAPEMTDAPQDALPVGPEEVSGLWALYASDRPDDRECRIALQTTPQGQGFGVYLEGCEKTAIARVAGWRVIGGLVALTDAGGEPVLRFRRTGLNRMEAETGGVTYRLEPAAMM